MTLDEFQPPAEPVEEPFPTQKHIPYSLLGLVMISALLLVVVGLQIGRYISSASSARELQDPNILPPSPLPTPLPTIDPCKTPTPSYVPLTKIIVSPPEPITIAPTTPTPTQTPRTKIAPITQRQASGIPTWPTNPPTPTTPCP